MKIGVIHATYNAIEPLEKVIAELMPEAEVVTFLNENLLYEVNKNGKVSKKDLRAFIKVLITAQESEVGGILIGCSVYCPYLKLYEPFIDVPLVTVDLPMLQQALDMSHKVGIIATTANAAPTAKKQLLQEANERGVEVDISTKIVTEGMTELKKGNVDNHNEIILEAAKELIEEGSEVIVLAQVTMAVAESLLEENNINVLSSPFTGVEKLKEKIYTSTEL